MSTEQFKKQHVELLVMVKKIVPLLNTKDIQNKNTLIFNYLNDLLSDLMIHLILEDNILYPKMMRSSDRTVAKTAKKYQDEMGGVAQVTESYRAKWNSSDVISENPYDFIKETKALFTALQERITREDKILYPMFDRLSGS